uniref:Toll-like receptor n=1 Tax=Procambarus clarkii TaxID=6728 RepID=A0A0B5CZA3_PROCL|nr:toll-like receptor [Procambarus clarkii]
MDADGVMDADVFITTRKDQAKPISYDGTPGYENSVRISALYENINSQSSISAAVKVTEVTLNQTTITYVNQTVNTVTPNILDSFDYTKTLKGKCFWNFLVGDSEEIPLDHLDPLLLYLPSHGRYDQSLNEQRSEEILYSGKDFSLPEGCLYKERGQKTVVCTGTNITEIPDFNTAWDVKIKNLIFNLTGIQTVTDITPLPRSLTSLYFSNGPLYQFNGQKLDRIPGLNTLSLDYNTLNTFSFVSVFNSSDPLGEISIKILNLKNNLISYPPEPHGTNETVLPRLEVLIMNNNPMSNLPGKLFKPLRNSPVTSLFLRNCSLGQFSGSPLEYLKGLKVLDLSKNMGLSVEELKELLVPLAGAHLEQLFLSNNNYIMVPTAALEQVNETLQMLDLHGSAFECLDNTSFPLMANLKTLNLMYSRINVIRYDTFQGFPALQELNLDGNGLMTVPSEALLPTLTVLTLSGNPRAVGNSAQGTFDLDTVDFSNMAKLQNLSFEEVPLRKVKVSHFNALIDLRVLHLSNCQISYIEPLSFRNLSKLEKLYLMGNAIQILSNETFTGLISLTYLDLSDNTIIFQTNQGPTYMAPRVPLSSTAGTHRFSDMPTALVKGNHDNSRSKRRARESDKLFNLYLSMIRTSTQQERGEGQVHKPQRGYKEQLYTFLPFRGLKELSYLDLSKNDIRNIFPELWNDLSHLTYLLLDSNNIKEWDEPNFSNNTKLETLSLTRNSLTTVTQAMVQDFNKESLMMVDLRFNEFQCGCSITNFNGTLNRTRFAYWSSYRCTENGHMLTFGEYMKNATCKDNSNSSTSHYANHGIRIVIISVSVALSLVMTVVTVYSKWWYVRYVIYNIRIRTMTHKAEGDKYLYDTFVCYSQSDRQWVFEHLLLKLEDGGRYRVCVHERDFTVGQEITENIISCIELSRKVIVVLTTAFVESSWCMFELQMVSNRILDERKCKLILVLLECIPEEKQTKKLRLLLKTRTYLAWVTDAEGQRLFWARLLKTISKPLATEAAVYTSHM